MKILPHFNVQDNNLPSGTLTLSREGSFPRTGWLTKPLSNYQAKHEGLACRESVLSCANVGGPHKPTSWLYRLPQKSHPGDVASGKGHPGKILISGVSFPMPFSPVQNCCKNATLYVRGYCNTGRRRHG